MIRFATATQAPKLRRAYGRTIGLAAAGVMIVFAITHLYRIDTFVPEIRYALPVSHDMATLLAVLLITVQVFALPFLLRMKLSELARFIGGLCVIIAPLAWLLIAIWNLGSGVSTAQLGEFYELPSSWLLVVFNVAWLGLNYFALWVLGYDMPKRLSK